MVPLRLALRFRHAVVASVAEACFGSDVRVAFSMDLARSARRSRSIIDAISASEGGNKKTAAPETEAADKEEWMVPRSKYQRLPDLYLRIRNGS
jgi:hypothetical protein